jgi:diadenosine tetraphosphate (Ap4A) HIT family hydrolase
VRERAVAANELAWAFLTHMPITPGHTLVSPIRHVAALHEMTTAERLAVLELADTVMSGLRRGMQAEGFNCAWNQEQLAGQSVPHFHLHVIPRRTGDSGVLGYDPRSMLYRTGERPASNQSELLAIRQQILSGIRG